MPSTLIAALTAARLLTLDVPYLPQTDALCGGAAVAMVFRYWGDAHADVRQFAPLVDRRARGIADAALIDAVRQRGWTAIHFDGSIDALEANLRMRRPVIVLVADRRDRYHYLVVIGVASDHVVVHDPSWGPSRAVRRNEFLRVWRPTNFWSLVVLPTAASLVAPAVSPLDEPRDEPGGQCAALLDDAVAEIRQSGLAEADAILGRVRAECPQSAGPVRELAAVRFAERRWTEAAALAVDALAIDPADVYTADVLGSSLFLLNDARGALRAWNRIGKPRLDTVRIEGLRHTRYQLVAAALGLEPNTVLTAEAFDRAQRRVAELPDHAGTRLSLRPRADGFASVDVVVAERSTLPRGASEWTATAVRTAIEREVSMSAPGATGQGELWSANWRWWRDRPRIALGFAAPRPAGLPGVWRVDANWETQTYTFESRETLREPRVHGGLTVTDWLSGSVRYSLSAGIDSWSRGPRATSVGASIEHRAFADRVALFTTATTWLPLGGDAPFTMTASEALFRSSAMMDGWVFRAAAGAHHVSDNAPFALWPGAGDGRARPVLLRAHRLLVDGVIDAGSRAVFGRTVTYGTAEAQRWFSRPAIARVAVAAFVDSARAVQKVSGGAAAHVDAGGGLRVKLPSVDGVLRVDVAHGLRDGATALTVGWLF